VLKRLEDLDDEQQRLEDERDRILEALRRFPVGAGVVFEDLDWKVEGMMCRFSAGTAQAWLRLHRGESKINARQTKAIPVRQQSKCKLIK
jgi:hypothetical protein